MKKNKLIFLIISCFISVFCFGQENNQLTFISRKDSLKKYSITLPKKAIIKTKNKIRHNVLIINATDSSIIAKEHVFFSSEVLSEKENKLLEKWNIEYIRVKKDKKLSKKEKKVKFDSIEMLAYIDTVKYKISEIEKIRIEKDHPSKFAMYSCMTFYSAFGMLTLVGFLGSINDSTINSSKDKRQQNALLAVGGLIGMAACLTWGHYIRFKEYYLRKWNVKIERKE